MSALNPKDKKALIIHYLVSFLFGILIASNIFLCYQYYQLSRATANLRSDIVTIIQAYNTLVTTLQQSGVVKQ